MAKLRHIALATDDPDATAEFYKAAFEFREVGRVSKENGKLGYGVFLSDGVINLAVLKFNTQQGDRTTDFAGIHHVGFLVEDVEASKAALEKLGAVCFHQREPGASTTGFFETKFVGPDGVVFDITDHPWIGSAAG